MSLSEARIQAVANAIYPMLECGYGLNEADELAKAAIAAADATIEVTDAMVLAYINEQQRIVAQDFAFTSLREASEYLGAEYTHDTRRCFEAALKVTK